MEIIKSFLMYWKAIEKHRNGDPTWSLLTANTDWCPF